MARQEPAFVVLRGVEVAGFDPRSVRKICALPIARVQVANEPGKNNSSTAVMIT
jgi:hypothetical protein